MAILYTTVPDVCGVRGGHKGNTMRVSNVWLPFKGPFGTEVEAQKAARKAAPRTRILNIVDSTWEWTP